MTEVIIVGTIHGGHLGSPLYGPEVLGRIVLDLKPNAILHELPLSQWDCDAGRPAQRDYRYPEGWAGDRAAQCLAIPQWPVDRPDRQEHYRSTRYFERQRSYLEVLNQAFAEATRQDPDIPAGRVGRLYCAMETAQRELTERGCARDFNCRSFDEMIRAKHALLATLAEMLLTAPSQATALADARFYDADWRERNGIMAANIVRLAREHPAGRLVVLTGCEHRYALRDLLGRENGLRLPEFWELVDVDPGSVPVSPDREAWEAGARARNPDPGSGSRSC